MTVVLARVPATGGLAMILVISAGPVRDVAYWEQKGRAAMFTVPVRGTLLGFRTPSVRIADVMPETLIDTVTLRGAYAHGRYRLMAKRRGAVLERELAASPSLLWALLLPIPTYSFGPEVHLFTALWLGTAWFVLGYWGVRAGIVSRRVNLAAALVTLCLGLAAIPQIFGLPVAHWSEWVGAVVGFELGWLLGTAALSKDVQISRTG